MVSTRLDLIKNSEVISGVFADYQIQKGSIYKRVLGINGDKTAGTWSGEIRDDYLEKNGVVLATFSFNSIVFDTDSGMTRFVATLTTADTSAPELAPTFDAGTTNPNIPNQGYYVYSFEYTDLSGETEEKFHGLVQVLPQATD